MDALLVITGISIKVIIKQIPTQLLVPTHPYVIRKEVLKKLGNPPPYRIKAIPYNGKFLVRDGTHSSCAALMRQMPVLGEIYETDEEFVKAEEYFEYKSSSIQDFIETYECSLRSQCERVGIYSIEDLVNLVEFYSLYPASSKNL